MPGPRPTPTSIKLLRGNPGRRPISPDEPAPGIASLDPPELYLEAGMEKHLKAWEHFAPLLARYGVVSQMDEYSLMMLCDAAVDYEDARKRVRDLGATALSPNGYQMPSVHVIEMRKAFERLKALLAEFGMTPASRTKVRVIKPISHAKPSGRKQRDWLDGTRG